MENSELFYQSIFLTLEKSNQSVKCICKQGKLSKALHLACILSTMRPKQGTSQKLTFNFSILALFFSLKSCSLGTLSAIALIKISLEAHQKSGEGKVSRKDCWTYIGPGADDYTSVLVPICFGIKHRNHVLHMKLAMEPNWWQTLPWLTPALCT